MRSRALNQNLKFAVENPVLFERVYPFGFWFRRVLAVFPKRIFCEVIPRCMRKIWQRHGPIIAPIAKRSTARLLKMGMRNRCCVSIPTKISRSRLWKSYAG